MSTKGITTTIVPTGSTGTAITRTGTTITVAAITTATTVMHIAKNG